MPTTKPLPKPKPKRKRKTKLEAKGLSLEKKKKLDIIYAKCFVKTRRKYFRALTKTKTNNDYNSTIIIN